jgi:hypothetical protein
MIHLKKFNESNVSDFKDFFLKKEFIKAVNIYLKGWGTNESPLTKDEVKEINIFIEKSPASDKDKYEAALKSATGTFG